MKYWLFAFLLWCGAALAAQPLLGSDELEPMLSAPELRIVDIRDAQSFAGGHIEGALNAPYNEWLGPPENFGILPPAQDMAALVQRLALTPDSHAVVVSAGSDGTDFGAAARVYWMLKSLGVKQLSILDGGMQSWDFDGMATTKAVSAPAPSEWQPQWSPRWSATRDEVLAHVQKGDAVLLDVRPQNFYLGQFKAPMARMPGTIPGALQQDFTRWVQNGSALSVAPEQARRLAQEIRRPDGQDLVLFCNTGVWSALVWFEMHEILGMKDVKIYPGSMVDWVQAVPMLPTLNAPSRSEQIVQAFAQAWKNLKK
ncbi:sulfurtransferase [Comamonas sp. NLF-1-9]|uniref:sulfurtransferase n=1 Tax=Comamonas sp. NLF-1-9 TaxID=2853163 RepID=UPI001C45E65B|nr:rhodanese-like domain-containing protein [Comamonas sp. NLF-1-9]QXL85478.1 sulfurtransferase [Comamonas sp. NLF-1-9]